MVTYNAQHMFHRKQDPHDIDIVPAHFYMAANVDIFIGFS